MICGRVFLVGCPRSGTTLLQSLLAAHPLVTSFPETHFFVDLVPSRAWARRLGLVSRRAGARLALIRAGIGPDAPPVAPPRLPLMSQWAAAFVRLLDETTRMRGRAWWVEKTPGHIQRIPEITRYVPGARFIHLLRDGAEVVASLYEVTRLYPETWGGAWSIDRCVERWLTDVRTSSRYRRVAGHLLVTYQSLTGDPGSTLRQVCAAVGLPFDPAMLSGYRQSAGTVVLPSEPWKAGVREAIHPRDRAKFERLFTAAEREDILRRVADVNAL